jgi:beta-phosphoglucomutase-like phosphatase (HAD superfamily)
LKARGLIHAVIFDFDGTLAKLNIDFSLMREQVFEKRVKTFPVSMFLPSRRESSFARSRSLREKSWNGWR